jgi:hypothetical protein
MRVPSRRGTVRYLLARRRRCSHPMVWARPPPVRLVANEFPPPGVYGERRSAGKIRRPIPLAGECSTLSSLNRRGVTNVAPRRSWIGTHYPRICQRGAIRTRAYGHVRGQKRDPAAAPRRSRGTVDQELVDEPFYESSSAPAWSDEASCPPSAAFKRARGDRAHEGVQLAGADRVW